MRSGGCGRVERCEPFPPALLLATRRRMRRRRPSLRRPKPTCLPSREAQQMSESDLERELNRRGQELMRKLLQGHLDQRSPGEAAGPVAGADGVERSERRVHERHLETTFGTVEVERLGYARPGHDSLHPLDAALNLPGERYSLEVRRRVAEAAASRSFDEALFDLSRSTGAEVPKRQAEQLVVRAAEDFDAFYEARRAAEGEPPPEGSVVVLTFDGKGVVLHREDLREATRKAAEKRRQHREQLSRFKRLKPGEKKHSKRMGHPWVRIPLPLPLTRIALHFSLLSEAHPSSDSLLRSASRSIKRFLRRSSPHTSTACPPRHAPSASSAPRYPPAVDCGAPRILPRIGEDAPGSSCGRFRDIRASSLTRTTPDRSYGLGRQPTGQPCELQPYGSTSHCRLPPYPCRPWSRPWC